MRRDSDDRNLEEPPIDRSLVVEAEVMSYADQPDECTLYPLVVPGDLTRMSTWITACGEDFVDLDEMR